MAGNNNGYNLQGVLAELERTPRETDAAGFIARNRALDELEVLWAALTSASAPDPGEQLTRRVVSLRDQLQQLNDGMAHRLRARLAAGDLPPDELLDTLQQYVTGDLRAPADNLAYDDLDVLVSGLLSTGAAVSDASAHWQPEMIHYQPTPARLVLALLQELRPTRRDVFVDVGSGLGTVPVLAALLTGVRAVGIEWHAGLGAYAQAVAQALRVPDVTFVCQDAQHADFSTGTIFYMFTPCTGAMLHTVLQRLDGEARRRALCFCTHGPYLADAVRRFATLAPRLTRDALPVSVFHSAGACGGATFRSRTACSPPSS